MLFVICLLVADIVVVNIVQAVCYLLQKTDHNNSESLVLWQGTGQRVWIVITFGDAPFAHGCSESSYLGIVANELGVWLSYQVELLWNCVVKFEMNFVNWENVIYVIFVAIGCMYLYGLYMKWKVWKLVQ